jgi:hypothetical protein
MSRARIYHVHGMQCVPGCGVPKHFLLEPGKPGGLDVWNCSHCMPATCQQPRCHTQQPGCSLVQEEDAALLNGASCQRRSLRGACSCRQQQQQQAVTCNVAKLLGVEAKLQCKQPASRHEVPAASKAVCMLAVGCSAFGAVGCNIVCCAATHICRLPLPAHTACCSQLVHFDTDDGQSTPCLSHSACKAQH